MASLSIKSRWYLADLVIEHIIQGDPRNVVHINLHLIEAKSPQEAYTKALALGRRSNRVYTNMEGAKVRVVFRGLRDLVVVDGALEDGEELAYTERIGVSKAKLREMLKKKGKLGVFAPRMPRDVPNYMPESIMRKLEGAGISREDVLKQAITRKKRRDKSRPAKSRAK